MVPDTAMGFLLQRMRELARGLICYRALPLVAALSTAAIVGCGESESSVTTAPTPQKCQVALAVSSPSIGPDGGMGTVTVTTAPECPWDVSTAANWLSGMSPTSGQGSSTVEFRVAPNPLPSVRQGEIVVNDNRVAVSQQAAPCRFELRPDQLSIAASGETREVSVATMSGCSWSASADVGWISFAGSTSGSGSGTLRVNIARNPGDERRIGSIVLGNLRATVTQAGPGTPESGPPAPGTPAPGTPTPGAPAPGCTYQAGSSNTAVAASGGTVTVSVSTGGGCAWTASSGADWVTVASASGGTGNGSVAFNVAANTGGARSGTLTVAGQTFTVTQAAAASAAACSYSIGSTSASMAAQGGTGTVAVSAGGNCAWSASSGAGWISITSGGSGTGNGSVAFSVAANTAGARSGTLTIAGQTFSVTQAAAVVSCSYSLGSSSASIGAGGGNGSVGVSTGSSCAWTASSGASWISITSGGSGTGNGSVAFSVAANTGGARSSTLSIAGQTFSVSQASAPVSCSYSINPSSVNISGAAGGSVAVSTGSGCTWTASSNVGWITVTSGASGTGNGSVSFSASAPSGKNDREGTVSIAGQTFTVKQKN